jgi:hypothetical protein
VSWRAIGCLASGAIVFVAIGLIGLSMATSRIGCPDGLRWGGEAYAPAGTPAPSPAFDVPGDATRLGSTFIGLATRDVYGPPGASAGSSARPQPEVIAMACGDGTYLTYRAAGAVPTATPSGAASGAGG